ncbi:hypothetical protein COY95_00615, partial [Candidatus Woesearchaeota archaeon CG_4_10_14_0_8_um_filter_47_5]
MAIVFLALASTPALPNPIQTRLIIDALVPPPPPENFSIALQGNQSIVLSWANTTGVYYWKLYVIDASSPVPPSGGFDYAQARIISPLTSLQWTDSFPLPPGARYYRLATVDVMGRETRDNTTLGSCTISLRSGLNGTWGRNMIGLCINATLSADSFVKRLPLDRQEPSITRLERSNPNREYYISHTYSGGSYNNFSLKPGEGYLVYVPKSCTYTFVGRAFEQGMSLRLIANNDSSLGRNYVSFPYTSSLPSAAALVRTFPYRLYEPSLTLLNRSNTSQEYWQPHAWG